MWLQGGATSSPQTAAVCVLQRMRGDTCFLMHSVSTYIHRVIVYCCLVTVVFSLCAAQDEGSSLVLPRDKVQMEVLNAAGGEINNALTNPFFGVL